MGTSKKAPAKTSKKSAKAKPKTAKKAKMSQRAEPAGIESR